MAYPIQKKKKDEEQKQAVTQPVSANKPASQNAASRSFGMTDPAKAASALKPKNNSSWLKNELGESQTVKKAEMKSAVEQGKKKNPNLYNPNYIDPTRPTYGLTKQNIATLAEGYAQQNGATPWRYTATREYDVYERDANGNPTGKIQRGVVDLISDDPEQAARDRMMYARLDRADIDKVNSDLSTKWDITGKTKKELYNNIYTAAGNAETQEERDAILNQMKTFENTPGSPLYNPYRSSTVSAEAKQYFGRNDFDSNWIAQNSGLLQYLKRNTSGSVAAPTKTSTEEEWAAYYYYQVFSAHQATQQIESELDSLKLDVVNTVNQFKSAYGDDFSVKDVIDAIDIEKNYKGIASLSAEDYANPVQLTKAVNWDDDSIYGMIEEALEGNDLSDIYDFSESASRYVTKRREETQRYYENKRYNEYLTEERQRFEEENLPGIAEEFGLEPEQIKTYLQTVRRDPSEAYNIVNDNTDLDEKEKKEMAASLQRMAMKVNYDENVRTLKIPVAVGEYYTQDGKTMFAPVTSGNIDNISALAYLDPATAMQTMQDMQEFSAAEIAREEETKRIMAFDEEAAQKEIDILENRINSVNSSDNTMSSDEFDALVEELDRKKKEFEVMKNQKSIMSVIQNATDDKDFKAVAEKGKESFENWNDEQGNQTLQELLPQGDMTDAEYLDYVEENSAYLFNNNDRNVKGASAAEQYHYFNFMSDDEKNTFYYLFEKNGKEVAEDYYTYIEDALKYRSAYAEYKNMQLDSVSMIGTGLKVGLSNWWEGLKQAFTKNPVQTENQYLASMVQQDLEDSEKHGGKFLGHTFAGGAYNLLTTTAQQLPNIALSVLTGPAGRIVSSLAMGISTYGNTYGQTLKEGYGEKEAKNYALMNAALETGLQYMFGGITATGGVVAEELAEKAASRIQNTFFRAAATIGLNMASEGNEEYWQEILDPIMRNAFLGENNEIRLISEEALYAGMLGALSAGIMDAPTSVETIQEAVNYTKLANDKGLLADAKNIDGVATKQISAGRNMIVSGLGVELIQQGLDSTNDATYDLAHGMTLDPSDPDYVKPTAWNMGMLCDLIMTETGEGAIKVSDYYSGLDSVEQISSVRDHLLGLLENAPTDAEIEQAGGIANYLSQLYSTATQMANGVNPMDELQKAAGRNAMLNTQSNVIDDTTRKNIAAVLFSNNEKTSVQAVQDIANGVDADGVVSFGINAEGQEATASHVQELAQADVDATNAYIEALSTFAEKQSAHDDAVEKLNEQTEKLAQRSAGLELANSNYGGDVKRALNAAVIEKNGLQTNLKEAQQQVDSLVKTGANSEKAQANLDSIQARLDDVNSRIDSLKLASQHINNLAGAIENARASVDATADAMDESYRDVTRAERAMNDARNNLYDALSDVVDHAYGLNGNVSYELESQIQNEQPIAQEQTEQTAPVTETTVTEGPNVPPPTDDDAPPASDMEDVKKSISTFSDASGVEAVKTAADGLIHFFVDGVETKEVTAEHIKEKSGFGTLINTALTMGTITEEEAGKQYKAVANLMNTIMKTQNPDMVWQFAGANMFAAIKTNADGQYSSTVDFSTVCRKTQEMISAMSQSMVELGRGLTKDEIVKQLQPMLVNKGRVVPCPVCYVFSRWMGIGGILDRIRDMQIKFKDASIEDLQARVAELDAEIDQRFAIMKQVKDNAKRTKVIDELARQKRTAYEDITRLIELLETDADEKDIQRAANANTVAVALVDAGYESNIGDAIEAIRARVETFKGVAEDLLADADILDEYTWVKTYRMSGHYENVPNNILYDLDKGEEFARAYPDAWKFRNTRGSGAGKAIVPYADARLGDFISGAKANSSNIETDAEGEVVTDEDNNVITKNILQNIKGDYDNLTTEQKKVIDKAIVRTMAQNLIGGQRYQSTSDFRYDYALDYIQSFFEYQSIGASMQSYTKIIEFADMVAAVGGDVNLSVMPKGAGYTTVKDANGVEHKVLSFSNVTGIDYDAAVRSSQMKGHDGVQLILVGINDDHVRLALSDDETSLGYTIGMVIPWHASGNKAELIKSMVENLGESYQKKNYTDYSTVQSDSIKGGKENETEAHKLRKKILTGRDGSSNWVMTDADIDLIINAEAISKIDGITQTEVNLIRDAVRNNDVNALDRYEETYGLGKMADLNGRSFEELRDVERRALAGDEDALAEYTGWTSGALYSLYKKLWLHPETIYQQYGMKPVMNGDTVTPVRLASNQAASVMPHEYWDTNSTRKTAYVNGLLFRSYCYNLGLNPRFTGVKSDGSRLSRVLSKEEKTRMAKNGEEVPADGRMEYGDFSDEAGYWKTLIDRSMYDQNGNYRPQNHITMTNFDNRMASPSYADSEWGDVRVQDPNVDVARQIGHEFAQTAPKEAPKRVKRVKRNVTSDGIKADAITDEDVNADVDAVEDADADIINEDAVESKPTPITVDNAPEENTPAKVESRAVQSIQSAMEAAAKHFGFDMRLGTKNYNRALRRRAAGYFTTKSEAVRVADGVMANTFYHETGHFLDKKYGFSVKNSNDIRGMLQSDVINHHGVREADFFGQYSASERPGEAIAEFVSHYTTDEAKCRQYAGEFYDIFEKTVSPEDLAVLRKVRDVNTQYMNIKNGNVPSADIGKMVQATTVSMAEAERRNDELFGMSTKDRIIRDYIDRFHPGTVVDAWVKTRSSESERGDYTGVENAMKNSLYAANIASELFYGNGGMVGRNGKRIGLFENGKGSLSSVFDVLRKTDGVATNEDHAMVLEYAKLKHSIDWAQQGKRVFGNEITMDTIRSRIADIEQNRPDVAECAGRLVDWWDAFMNEWVVGRYMSEKQYETLKDKNPNYIPLMRVVTEISNGKASSAAVNGGNAVSFMASSEHGSNLDTIDPIESMQTMATQIIRANLQNDIYIQLENAYNIADGMARFIAPANKDVTVNTRNIADEFSKWSEQQGTDNPFGNDSEILDQFLHSLGNDTLNYTDMVMSRTSSDAHSINVFHENGSIRSFEVRNKDLFQALNYASNSYPTVIDGLSKLVRESQTLLTGKNPLFWLPNVFRDTQNLLVYGSERNIAKVMRNISAANMAKSMDVALEMGFAQLFGGEANIRNNKYWKEYQRYKAMGGGSGEELTGLRESKTATLAKRELMRNYTDAKGNVRRRGAMDKYWSKKGTDNIAAVWSDFQNTLESIGDFTEDATRFAEFIGAMDKLGAEIGNFDNANTASIQKAFRSSRTVTTEFTVSGAKMKGLSALFRFANASIQGNAQQIRLLTDSKTELRKGDIASRYVRNFLLSGALGGISEILLRGLWKDWGEEDKDEEERIGLYEHIPADIRNSYWCIPNFLDKGSGSYIRIPKAQGIVAGSIGAFSQAFASSYMDGNMEEEMQGAVRKILGEANPLSSPVFSVIREIDKNETYYGSAIETEYMQNYAGSPNNYFDDTTPEWAKFFANTWNAVIHAKNKAIGSEDEYVSPVVVEYAVQQYGGVVSNLYLPVLQNIANGDIEKAITDTKDKFVHRMTINPYYSNDISSNYRTDKETTENIMKSFNSQTANPDIRSNMTEEERKTAFKELKDIQNTVKDIDSRISAEYNAIFTEAEDESMPEDAKNASALEHRRNILAMQIDGDIAMQGWLNTYGSDAYDYKAFYDTETAVAPKSATNFEYSIESLPAAYSNVAHDQIALLSNWYDSTEKGKETFIPTFPPSTYTSSDAKVKWEDVPDKVKTEMENEWAKTLRLELAGLDDISDPEEAKKYVSKAKSKATSAANAIFKAKYDPLGKYN